MAFDKPFKVPAAVALDADGTITYYNLQRTRGVGRKTIERMVRAGFVRDFPREEFEAQTMPDEAVALEKQILSVERELTRLKAMLAAFRKLPMPRRPIVEPDIPRRPERDTNLGARGGGLHELITRALEEDEDAERRK